MRDVAVAGDLVGGIDDHDALAQFVGEDTGDFTQHGGLADAGLAEQEQAGAGFDEIADYLDSPVDGPASPAGEADDLAAAIAKGGYAVECVFDSGAIIVAEGADGLDDVLDVVTFDLPVGELDLLRWESSDGPAAEVEDYFDQVIGIGEFPKAGGEGGRKRGDQRFQLGEVFVRVLDLDWLTLGAQGGPTKRSIGGTLENGLRNDIR